MSFFIFTSPKADDALMLCMLLGGLVLAALLGQTARGARREAEAGIVPGAVLFLSGLLTGLAFLISVTGFSAREQAQVREALSVGRAWQYAGMLDEPARQASGQLLKAYLSDRIHFFREGTGEGLRNRMAESRQKQAQLWSLAEQEVRRSPSPAVMSVLEAYSALGTSLQQTQATWRRQLPDAAWCVLLLFAVSASFLAGYRGPSGYRARRILLFVPVLTALTLFMIMETDLPGQGVIHVTAEDLEALNEVLLSSGTPGSLPVRANTVPSLS